MTVRDKNERPDELSGCLGFSTSFESHPGGKAGGSRHKLMNCGITFRYSVNIFLRLLYTVPSARRSPVLLDRTVAVNPVHCNEYDQV